jgi:iron complex outermembrane receptor protein
VIKRASITAALLSLPLSAQAQQDTAAATSLAPVVVTVTRGSGRSVLGSPYAITISEPDSSRPGQRHASVDETLALIPGVTAISRNNPAQDPRLSIRGFGARSAFGVRGIRVLRDGMPITLPDGQTPLDYISLESVDRVEVLRGAASALYGNSSGGVVDLRTDLPSSGFSGSARQWIGSNDLSRSVVEISGRSSRSTFTGDITHTRTDGDRIQSKQRSTSGFGKVTTQLSGSDIALMVLGYSNPLSQNPGALTMDELQQNPEQADATSLRRDARKAVNQVQLGLSAGRKIGTFDVSLLGYGGARSLDNPLTFAVVEVGRHTWGTTATARAKGTVAGIASSFSAGFDLQWQNDLRRNFGVCADTVRSTVPTAACPDPGSDRGVVTLDQRELVSSAGAYISDDLSFTARLIATAGVRADRVRFEVKDRLINGTNPDDSGDRDLGAISPVAGILFRAAPTHSLYANVSSAFETPTATELGNHADGTAGINPDLDPQRSLTFESGAKGWVGTYLRYDAAVFATRVRDELVPFEIPQSNGRRYFRNAGRTRRSGAEAAIETGTPSASLMASYTWSRFRFVDYVSGSSDFGGNTIPGIPEHRFQGALRFQRRGNFLVLESEAAGRAWTDDANTFRAPGYFVAGLRAGASATSGRIVASIAGGVQNIFDRRYASSIVVNAARGKYFEPAGQRAFYASITIGSQSPRR